MPRVESQSNAVASHSHSPSAHRPTTGDAKPPSSPFQDLLDATNASTDGADPPVPAGSDTRGDQRTRRTNGSAPTAGTDEKAADGNATAANATDGQVPDSQGVDGQVANGQVPADPTAGDNDTTDALTAIAAALAALGDKPADGPAKDSVGGDDAPGAPSMTPADRTADLTADNPPSVVGTPTPTPVPTVAVPAVALPPVIVAPPAVAPSAPTTAADTAPNVASDKTAIAATGALNAQVQAQAQGAADGSDAAPGGKGTNPPSIADAPNPSTANNASIANKALNAKQDPSAATPQAAAPDGASEAATDMQPTSPAPAQPGSPAGPNVKSAPAPARVGRVANPDAPKPDEPTAAGVDATINTTGDKPADPIQTVALQHPTDRSAAPTAVTSAAPTPTATAANLPATGVPIAGLAVAITSQAQAGRNRFEIRLDPPELGRIDVRLDVDRDGRVTSRLVADRPETLDLLRRDAPELQRALQDAGLKTSDSGLQFSLRDQGFGAQNQDTGSGRAGAARLVVPDPDMATTIDTAQASYGRMLRLGGGIDIRV